MKEEMFGGSVRPEIDYLGDMEFGTAVVGMRTRQGAKLGGLGD